MIRRGFPLLLALVTLVSLAGGVRADDDDPEFRGRKLSEWLDMLHGERSEKCRLVALQALGSAAAAPSIWQSSLAQERRAGLLAVELIGPTKSKLVFPAIIGALRSDPDEIIREKSALAIGRLATRYIDDAKEAARKDESLRKKLIKDLVGPRDGLAVGLREDKSPRVREACAAALGKLEWMAKDAVPFVAVAIKDPNPEVRAAAVEALRRIGDDAGEALQALQEVVKDERADKLIRSLAVQALGRLGPDADVSLELLLKIWHDPAAPVEVRADVAEALGSKRLDKTGAAVDLGKELRKENAVEIRRAAVMALDSFGPGAKPAVIPLREALKDEDKFVRALSMHALGQIGKTLGTERSNVVKALLAAMNDRVLEVRVAAIETVGVLGADGLGDDQSVVIERLTEAKRDTAKPVRDAAQEALKKMGK